MALGVFLLRIRETFVENPLVDVRELREIFMIIGGMYYTVIMSFGGLCSDHCGMNGRFKCNPCDKSTVHTNSSSLKISEHPEAKLSTGYM